MPQVQELVVITKTYDLVLWSCQHTSQFPRNHRFVLGDERNLYNLLETLIKAKYQRERTPLLDQANLRLATHIPNRHVSRPMKDCTTPGSMQGMPQSIGDHHPDLQPKRNGFTLPLPPLFPRPETRAKPHAVPFGSG